MKKNILLLSLVFLSSSGSVNILNIVNKSPISTFLVIGIPAFACSVVKRRGIGRERIVEGREERGAPKVSLLSEYCIGKSIFENNRQVIYEHRAHIYNSLQKNIDDSELLNCFDEFLKKIGFNDVRDEERKKLLRNLAKINKNGDIREDLPEKIYRCDLLKNNNKKKRKESVNFAYDALLVDENLAKIRGFIGEYQAENDNEMVRNEMICFLEKELRERNKFYLFCLPMFLKSFFKTVFFTSEIFFYCGFLLLILKIARIDSFFKNYLLNKILLILEKKNEK